MLAYVLIPAAYLLGSTPFGLLIGRAVAHVDIRTAGSRNIGATNVARLVGLPWGVLALALDILKGLGPVLAAHALAADPLPLSLVAAAAIAGHVWPVFLGFQGGKAVATTIGAFAGLALVPTAVAVAACVLVIALTRYVSLGSLTLGLALPLCCAFLGAPAYTPLAFAVTLLVFWRHRENLSRLATGRENKLGRKS